MEINSKKMKSHMHVQTITNGSLTILMDSLRTGSQAMTLFWTSSSDHTTLLGTKIHGQSKNWMVGRVKIGWVGRVKIGWVGRVKIGWVGRVKIGWVGRVKIGWGCEVKKEVVGSQ